MQAGSCSACGLDLRRPPAATLWWLDNELARLSVQRGAVLSQLRAASRAGSAPSAKAPGSIAATPPVPAQTDESAAPVELQNLLLALGAFSLIIAGSVFATVTWTRLGAAVQGAILLGLTAAGAAATTAVRRRGLRSTAEAVGAVTVVLALVDARAAQGAAFPHVRGQLYWAGALALVALGAWFFGRLAAVRSPRLAAVTMVQLSAPLAVTALRPSSLDALAVVLVVQAAVVLAVRRSGRLRDLEWPVRVGAPAAWATGTGFGLVDLFTSGFHPVVGRVAGPAAVVVCSAAVSVLVAWWWRDRDNVRRLASGAVAILGLAAFVGVAHVAWSGQALAMAAGLAAVAVLAVSTRLPARWGEGPAQVAGTVIGLAALVVLAAAGASTRSVPRQPQSLPANLSALLLLAQAAAVLALTRRSDGGADDHFEVEAGPAAGPTPSREFTRFGPAVWPARTGALVAWSVAALAAGGRLLSARPAWSAIAPCAAVAFAGAAVAALTAWWWRRRPDVSITASAAATTVGLAAVIGGLHAWLKGDHLGLAAGALALIVLGLAARLPSRWAGPPAAVAGVALVTLGVATTFAAERFAVALTAPFLRHGAVWSAHPRTGIRSLVDAPPGLWGPVALAVLLLSAAVVAVAHRLPRAVTAVSAVSITSLAVTVVPLLLSASVELTVVWLLAIAVAAATGATRQGGHVPRPVSGMEALLWCLAVWATASAMGWALLLPGTTVAVLAVAAVTAAAVAVVGARSGLRGLALFASPVTVLSFAGLVPVILRAAGSPVGTAWLVLSACVLSAAAWLIDAPPTTALPAPSPSRRPLRTDVTVAIELSCVAAAALGALGVALSGSSDEISLTLLAASLTFAAQATRPTRRYLIVPAVLSGLSLVWQRLAVGGVTTVEAYSLPLAAALLTAGALLYCRRPQQSTWITFGPGLMATAAPTTLLALGDPGLVRPLGALGLGAVLVLAGASRRWQAPLGTGATVIVVIGLQQLAPAVNQLPRWVSFGIAGLILLSVGATYERRRAELVELRRRVTSLR